MSTRPQAASPNAARTRVWEQDPSLTERNPTHEQNSSTKQNNAELTELLFAQRTKENYSRVIKRLKSGTTSDERTERKILGMVPATGGFPTKPTNNNNTTTQRQLWEERKNIPTLICNDAVPSILGLFNVFQTF